MHHRTILPALTVLALGFGLGLGASSCGRDAEPHGPSRARTSPPQAPVSKVARRADDFQNSRKTRRADPGSPEGDDRHKGQIFPADEERRSPRVRSFTRRGPPREQESPERPSPDDGEAAPEHVVIDAVAHEPERLRPGETVTIHARIRSEVELASVTLHYTTHSTSERGAEMTPLEPEPLQPAATVGGESPATRYSARLRGFPEGTLVKYWITVTDGNGGETRFPRKGNPTRTLGLYIEDPSIESALPVYHLFLSHSALSTLNSNPFSDTYQRGDFAYQGKVYCDVGLRYRGQTSRRYPKRQWKIKFHPDHHFISPTPGRNVLSSINLKSAYVDKIYIRETLGFELFRELGEPYCETEFIRTYLNGELLGLYLHVENPGSTYLKRNGLDENGWLWKAYGEGHGEGQSRRGRSRFFSGSREAELERSTRYGGMHRFELKAGDPTKGSALLDRFLRNINRLQGAALEDYLRENVDVDSLVNYLAACQLMHNADHVMKNYLIYADSNGKFAYLPWDLDLTHGRNYECGPGILNDTIRYDLWDSEFGDEALLYGTLVHPKCDGFWNALINAFLGRAKAFRPLYYERLAELLERYYHPEVLIPKAERLRDRIREDVRLDRQRWGTYRGEQDFDRRFARFLDWVPRRYEHLRRKLAGLGYRVRGL